MLMKYGYEYFRDEQGNDYAVSNSTGEITEAVNITVPVGSMIRTPEQQQAYKEYLKQKDKNNQRIKTLNELGDFYFVGRENQLGNLSEESVARLIFLCTFLDFNNYFMRSQRTHIKKSDLKSVLALSAGTIHKFWHEVSPIYVEEDINGLKLTNSDIVRGKIAKSVSYQRLYMKAVRELYRKTKTSQHHYLGRVFKMLPFINFEYNIICWNPYETILDDIEPLTIAEFCDLIGYDVHDYKKMLNKYNQITFDVGGEQEYFLSCVINNNEISKAKLFVNPHVLYCGSDYKRVEILGAFCKA